MTDIAACKAGLRKELRSQRQALTAQAQRMAARRVVAHMAALAEWPGAQAIALYSPADGEISPLAIAALCHQLGKAVYLPVIGAGTSMHFARHEATDTLIPNRYGIPEPSPGAASVPVNELDILVLPLVAWDRCGRRLGMGGGYYDRALSQVSDGPLLVGLAHTLQEVDQVPVEPWDNRLEVIISDGGVHRCQDSSC